MKRIVLAVAALSVASMAMADCKDVVHARTMAPVSELKSFGTDAAGVTTVVRSQDTSYAPMGVKLSSGEVKSTVFQCDSKGLYRQYLVSDSQNGWSGWRDGSEWNASYWMTF